MEEVSTFRVALADDHAKLREVMRRILSAGDGIEVVADVGSGIALLDFLRHQQNPPDMVILDVTMPGLSGLEIVPYIRVLFPKIKILIFTMHEEREFVSRAFSLGADGYLLKEEDVDELFAAISSIRAGNTYRSPLLNSLNYSPVRAMGGIG
jgi:DNA-binding NarL/FixJ family response regulator